MIKINLLPVRAERRRLGMQQQMLLFGLLLVLVGIGLYYWYSATAAQIHDRRAKISEMETEITQLAAVIAEVDKFKKDRKTLQDKLDVIQSLQKDRKIAVHYMDEINQALPERVWLEMYDEKAGILTLRGKALNPDDVAAFMRNLAKSPYFKEVELDVTTQGEIKVGAEAVKVNDFTIRFKAGDKAAPPKAPSPAPAKG